MSDIQAHANAFLGLLVGAPDFPVFDGSLPQVTPAPPYVLVYFASNRPSDAGGNTLKGTSDVFALRATVHCVGGNQTAARGVAAWVESCVLDKRPAVAGRNPGLIKQDDSRDPDKDETTGPVVMDAVQLYRWSTQPA